MRVILDRIEYRGCILLRWEQRPDAGDYTPQPNGWDVIDGFGPGRLLTTAATEREAREYVDSRKPD